VDARFPVQEPTLHRIVGHAIAALAVIYVIPGSAGSTVVGFSVIFALVLPALVYLCLTAVWFLRLAQSSRGSSWS
jgi:hypothetical protein